MIWTRSLKTTSSDSAVTEYLERNTCKVILLSATPFNKTCLDLGAPLRLFLPDQKDIPSIKRRGAASVI